MRSSLVISCVLLVVVIAGGLWLSVRAAAASAELEEAAQALQRLTETGEWDAAAELLGQVQARWEQQEKPLQMQVIHEDTDDVTLALAAIWAGVRTKSEALCLWGCGQLRESARHLFHRDAFTLQNVL